MLKREEWFDLARKLDWEFSYVSEAQVFPVPVSGGPWLPHEEWQAWDEPYRTTYSEYVKTQHRKEMAVEAVHEAIGGVEHTRELEPGWINGLKLHAATFPLAEFAATVGGLRAARFGRDSAWRNTSLFGALDELRHTQIPLKLMHDLVKWDRGFDFTHKLLHSDNWVGIAGRHLCDELLLTANPIEFAVATHFVFETGFTNLQFIGLSSLAHRVGDSMFEKMVQSIQTDEARHAQIGKSVLATLVRHDPTYAQYLVDKWFWRSWLFFAVVSGLTMDYLTPLACRTASFKEFVEEWILEQFQKSLDEVGLKRPWYWDTFLLALENYHHMVYLGAYSHRATVWFDFKMPEEQELRWLRDKYPSSWDSYDANWRHIAARWVESGPTLEWHTHGLTPIGFCNLCQLVLSGGTPQSNSAKVHEFGGKKYIFCSEPCLWIFQSEPERYAAHEDVVKRILAGKAPGNLLELVRSFGLSKETWGRDIEQSRRCLVPNLAATVDPLLG